MSSYLSPRSGAFFFGAACPPVSLDLLYGGFHLLPDRTGSVGIVGRRPQLIVRRLPLAQWPCVGQMPPRQKRPLFNRDTLIVVDDLIRDVAGRLRECPNVHRALGGICGADNYKKLNVEKNSAVCYNIPINYLRKEEAS